MFVHTNDHKWIFFADLGPLPVSKIVIRSFYKSVKLRLWWHHCLGLAGWRKNHLFLTCVHIAVTGGRCYSAMVRNRSEYWQGEILTGTRPQSINITRYQIRSYNWQWMEWGGFLEDYCHVGIVGVQPAAQCRPAKRKTNGGGGGEKWGWWLSWRPGIFICDYCTCWFLVYCQSRKWCWMDLMITDLV